MEWLSSPWVRHQYMCTLMHQAHLAVELSIQTGHGSAHAGHSSGLKLTLLSRSWCLSSLQQHFGDRGGEGATCCSMLITWQWQHRYRTSMQETISYASYFVASTFIQLVSALPSALAIFWVPRMWLLMCFREATYRYSALSFLRFPRQCYRYLWWTQFYGKPRTGTAPGGCSSSELVGVWNRSLHCSCIPLWHQAVRGLL